jgi:ABC-type phosphate transport system auxiliary subunit
MKSSISRFPLTRRQTMRDTIFRIASEKFVRTSMLRLQQEQMLLRSKLDRVYEDRLSDAIPEELWNSKSAALQDELPQVRTEMERHEVASPAYGDGGPPDSRTRANRLFLVCCENPHEQAR